MSVLCDNRSVSHFILLELSCRCKVSVLLWILFWIGGWWNCSWPCGNLLVFAGSGCFFLPYWQWWERQENCALFAYYRTDDTILVSCKRFPIWIVLGCIDKSESKGSGFRYSSVNATFFTIESALCVCLCLECLQLHSDMCLCVCAQLFFLLRCMSSWHICLFCVFWLTDRIVPQLLEVEKILPSFMQ